SGASFRRYQAGQERRRSRWVCACYRDVLKILQGVGVILRRLRGDEVADTVLWVHPKRGRSLEATAQRSEEHTSELQSRFDLVSRLLLEKKKQRTHSVEAARRRNSVVHVLHHPLRVSDASHRRWTTSWHA